MSSNDTEGLVLRLCRLLRARRAEGVAGTTRLFMKQSHRTAIAAVIFAAVFASTASAAMAIPPGDGDACRSQEPDRTGICESSV